MRDGEQRSVDAVPVLAEENVYNAIVATADANDDLQEGVPLGEAVGDERPVFAVYVPHSVTCTFVNRARAGQAS